MSEMRSHGGSIDGAEVEMDLPGPVSIMATLESELGSKMIEPSVDTGACVSMISHDLWRNTECEAMIDGSMPTLCGANGHLLDVVGRAWVYLQIDEQPYKIEVCVVRGLGIDMLLGADFLRACGARLDFRDMTVALDGNRPIALYLAENAG